MQDTIKAMIFDFDGLILDTETSLVEAWRQIFDEHGLVLPTERWAAMLGKSSDPPEVYDLLEQRIGPVDREVLRSQRLSIELALLEGEGPMPGVQDLLKAAHEAGLQLAVASSSEHEWVDAHLLRLGLAGYFETVVCADDVQATKPAPDLYLLALDRIGVRAHEAIALEDSEHGVVAARRAGLRCVAIPNAVTRGSDFRQATVVVETLDGMSLKALVSKLLSL